MTSTPRVNGRTDLDAIESNKDWTRLLISAALRAH